MTGFSLKMIGLTDLRGTRFYVKASAIDVVGQESTDEFANATSVVTIGTKRYGVKETVGQIVTAIQGSLDA